MSVKSQIDRLNAVKTRVRTNLVAQGITVPADTTLDEMATLILSVAGYTPEKGVDYWTEADQESIVQQVITALGTPVFGRVDADNNIILTGELADGTYTIKYEDADGNVTEIGTIEVGGIPDESGPITIEWSAGVKLDKNTGAEGSGANYGASQSIPYDSDYQYTIATTNSYIVQTAICWYASDGSYLGWNDATGAGTDGEDKTAVLVPLDNSASFRIRAYTIYSSDDELRTKALNTVSIRKDLETTPAYTNLLNTYLVGRDVRFSQSAGASANWRTDCLGMIMVAIPFNVMMEKTLRIKALNIAGQTLDGKSTNFNVISSADTFKGYMFNTGNASLDRATCAVNEGNNTYSFLINDENVTAHYDAGNTMYASIVVNTTGTAVTDEELAQIVITIDEPIV